MAAAVTATAPQLTSSKVINWKTATGRVRVLICLPVILLALVIQRHVVSGLTLGGVKG